MSASSSGNDLEMAKVTLTTFIDEETKEGLKALAEVEMRSMSQMTAVLIERAVREAIAKGIIAEPAKKQDDRH